MELYKQKIMDHYHNSQYRGVIDNPDFSTDQTSPSCGDRVMFDGMVVDGVITDCKFRGEGSILGQAVASMLCERAVNAQCSEVLALEKVDLLEMIGTELGPTRLRTVMFTLETLQKGIAAHVGSHQGS